MFFFWRPLLVCSFLFFLSSPFSSLELLENLGQKVLEAEGDVPVAVVVVLLEHVRHALEGDAGLDEEVEAHNALVALVVGMEEQLDKLGAEAVAEGDEGVVELGEGDVAAAVGVEAVKQGAPRGQEGPEAAELLEADGAAAVGVEHADHHADRVRVEGGPVAVDEGGGELALREMASSYFFYTSSQPIEMLETGGFWRGGYLEHDAWSLSLSPLPDSGGD